MLELPQIIEDIRTELTAKNAVRDTTLNRSRELIRFCALSIRAIHRHEWDEAENLMRTARQAADVMAADLDRYADLYEAGYTQDALKELVEAHTLYAMVRGQALPGPAELKAPSPAYLNGLAEAASELRRYILDLIRLGRTREGEPYLAMMDDVYIHLVTMDYPDALTGGLRRTTDVLRGVLERTRGDLTVAVRQSSRSRCRPSSSAGPLSPRRKLPMTTENRLLRRAPRRTPIILILALVIVAALAGTVWGAKAGAPWSPWRGLIAAVGADATATPTRTPRPETPAPTLAPVDLAIATLVPTPAATATPAPQPTAAPTVEPLTPHMIKVVERYGMDMSRRFIVVDLASQTMTIWDPGNPTRIMPVSTGDESRGYRTLAWYGLVGDYWGTFQASGVYADEGWYLFEDAGHILIHSAPYKLAEGRKVYEEQDALGAYPASKGCIRLSPEDAQWFTEWNPKGVPIVILPKDEGLGIN